MHIQFSAEATKYQKYAKIFLVVHPNPDAQTSSTIHKTLGFHVNNSDPSVVCDNSDLDRLCSNHSLNPKIVGGVRATGRQLKNGFACKSVKRMR